MSVRVLSRVLEESDEKLGRRLILLAIADNAHDDGIAWPPREDIARKTRMSLQHVSELVTALVKDGALELRKAQRGRRRINVYRVILSGLIEPNYDRLPFVLNEPFTGSEIPTSSYSDEVGSTRSTGSDLPVNPAISPYIEPSVEPSVPLSPASPSKQEKDAVWIALEEVFGKPTTPGHRSRFGRVQKELLADSSLTAGLVPGEISVRAGRYRLKWPDADLTLEALAKHWPDLRAGVNGRKSSLSDRIVAMGGSDV
jgi:hypothetical protein